MQLVERRLGRPLEVYLREEYVDRGRRQSDIAIDLGIETGTVSRWMRELGIETRALGPRTTGTSV